MRLYGECRFSEAGGAGIGPRWVLYGYKPNTSRVLKQVFESIPRETIGHCQLPDTPQMRADLRWFFMRYPFAISDNDNQRLETGHAQIIERNDLIDRILRDDWQPNTLAQFREDRQPWHFQSQAGAIAAQMGGLLILDDVGLGKTVSALAAFLQYGRFPAVVVCQAHLGEQWQEDFIVPFTTLRAHVIKGTRPYELPDADIYIFKYSNISGWIDYFEPGRFHAFAFDEIQELRTGFETKKGAAAKAIAQNCGLGIGLTATPVYNYGSEIFNVVEVIKPGALGSWADFIREWCTSTGNGKWAVREPDALGHFLREQNIAIRRTEHDVGKQMPPVNTLVHEVPYDEDVIESCEAEAIALAQRVLEGSFHTRGLAARELDKMQRRITGMAKARHVAALVKMLVDGGERVLLGGWHRDVYDVWLDELKDCAPVMYTGSETPARKRKTKAAFVAGDAGVMIISNRSGAGLDGLQDVSKTVVHGELDWSPQVHKQLTGRLRRSGQRAQVDAIFCHCNGGSDPAILEMLGLKSDQARGIVDPFSERTEIVEHDDTRMRTLAKQVLARRKSP
ncbi:SNF2-related protein [Oricola sp.]|uniref:SNF2-related protein n=1 Tax=Oricola sp. TaxID=1979950 RepID=UPI003BA9039C